MSRIDDAVNRFRRSLLSRDEATASDMTEVYGVVYARLSAEFDRLTLEIAAMRAAGKSERYESNYLHTRLPYLLRQAHDELESFAGYADRRITDAQRVAILDANLHSRELITDQLPHGFKAVDVPEAFRHLNTAAVEHMAGRLSDGSPLRDLLQELAPNAVRTTRDTLTTGLAQGKNPRVVAEDLKTDLNVPLTRALTIARTETLSTYRAVSLENYRANDDVVTGWMWTASLSYRTCGTCLALDGAIFPLDEPFASHICCRCSPIPITKTWAELGFTGIDETSAAETDRETGAEWFDRQPERVQMQVLGPGKMSEYQAGKLSLRDLVGYRVDKDWGPQRWERSLTQIRQGKYAPPKKAMGAQRESQRVA